MLKHSDTDRKSETQHQGGLPMNLVTSHVTLELRLPDAATAALLRLSAALQPRPCADYTDVYMANI